MRRIHLFCEDAGHEQFLKALLNRFEREYAIEIEIRVYSARGGHGRMVHRLRNYIKSLQEGRINAGTPDLIVVVRDANDAGFNKILSTRAKVLRYLTQRNSRLAVLRSQSAEKNYCAGTYHSFTY